MFIVYKLGGTSQCKIGYDRLINQLKDNVKNNVKNNVKDNVKNNVKDNVKNNVKDNVKNNVKDNVKSFIVLSAVSGVTNNLVKFTETKDIKYIDKVLELNYDLIKDLELEKELFEDVKNKLLDLCQNYIKSYDMTDIYEKSEIIGYGEVFSTNIFYRYIDSYYDFKFNELILYDSYKHIKSKKEIYQCNSTAEFYFNFDVSHLAIYDINIFQGFIGSTPSGKKVLLGRGGSDTTGSLIANALNAEYYEVWTDVDGIYTADPRIFPATLVKSIDYELVQEIASMGAKVMHPLSIKPCFDKNIPIYVKNTFNHTSEGTKITCISESDINTDKNIYKFYALQKNETIFKIKSLDMWNSIGFLNDIFRKFSENKIDINIVTTSQFSISATTSEQNKYKLLEIKELLSEKYEVNMITNCTILSIVSRNIKDVLKNIDLNKISYEIIHISDNNMTINLVLNNFNYDHIINFLE
jgi:aspartate kinase